MPVLTSRKSPLLGPLGQYLVTWTGFRDLAKKGRLCRTGLLGKHLRKRRMDLGLSQADVARRLGAKEDTVCNWENGRSSPSLRFVPRIIDFLGYVPDDATGGGSLGERTIAFRRRHGLSQQALAEQLGLDPSTVASWDRGLHRPSRSLAERLEGMLHGD